MPPDRKELSTYGSTTSPEYLFPFAAIFGGVAQFAAGMWAFRARWKTAGGWVLVGSSVAATYTAAARMLEGAWGGVILPLDKYERDANVPGSRFTKAIENERAMPGVRQGQ